jgi:hypothetical protein
MLHVVKQIQHHFPIQSRRVVVGLIALSVAALVVGVALILWNE